MTETSEAVDAPEPKKKGSVQAREAEAVDGYVEIVQCGVTLRVPFGNSTPTKAMLRFRGLNDDLTEIPNDRDGFKANMMGTRELLSVDQWDALLAADPTAGDFEEIGRKLQESQGN